MIIKLKSSNYLLANLAAQLQLGSMRRLRYINVAYSKMALNVLKILYKEGIIRLFVVYKNNSKIMVYFKYLEGSPIFKFKIISKPSRRIY
jgi:ribosomal protein S8